jgi:cytochrome c553
LTVIAALARFYAQQVPPISGPGKNAEGMRLYQKGAKDVPACLQCHGEAGQGRGAVPRLAGQHKAYLFTQLRAFSIAARIGDPMNHHVWVMTPQQAEDIAAYLGN